MLDNTFGLSLLSMWAHRAVVAVRVGASEIISAFTSWLNMVSLIIIRNVISFCVLSFPDMELMWFYSLCQCVLSMSMIVVSVRLCMAVSGVGKMGDVQNKTQGAVTHASSVSRCLRLCLGWVGAVGGAVGVPVTILLNLRTAQCLYTCITLVCCPMLVRNFMMFLFLLLTLDGHLQHELSVRYANR